MLEVPRIVAALLFSETLFAPLLASATEPVKSFACVSEIAFAPALNVTDPAPADSATAPVSEMLPPVEVTAKVPLPRLEVPSTVAVELVSATLFAPLLFSETAPVNLLPARLRAKEFAPALNEAAPAEAACVMAPAWEIAPPSSPSASRCRRWRSQASSRLRCSTPHYWRRCC